MPALVPGIHVVHLAATKDLDGRGKPGHDGKPGGVRREAQGITMTAAAKIVVAKSRPRASNRSN